MDAEAKNIWVATWKRLNVIQQLIQHKISKKILKVLNYYIFFTRVILGSKHRKSDLRRFIIFD